MHSTKQNGDERQQTTDSRFCIEPVRMKRRYNVDVDHNNAPTFPYSKYSKVPPPKWTALLPRRRPELTTLRLVALAALAISGLHCFSFLVLHCQWSLTCSTAANDLLTLREASQFHHPYNNNTKPNPPRQENGKVRGERGIVACLTDRASVVQALALVKDAGSSRRWLDDSNDAVPLELYYHSETLPLSYFLQSQLEQHSLVVLTDLAEVSSYENIRATEDQLQPDIKNHLGSCLKGALQTTQLTDILLVQPSILFLSDDDDDDEFTRISSVLWRSPEENQDHASNNKECQKFVSVTDHLLEALMIRSMAMTNTAGLCLADRLNATTTTATVHYYYHNGTNGNRDVQSTKVAKIYKMSRTGSRSTVWVYPTSSDPQLLLWIRHHLEQEPTNAAVSDWSNHNSKSQRFALVDTIEANSTRALPETYYRQMLHRWHLIVSDAMVTLMMDARSSAMEWVAFDGGFHNFDKTGIVGGGAPINSIRAVQHSLQKGASYVNIDLTITKDKHLIASHADTVFSPFSQAILSPPISSLDATEARKLTNPCFTENVARSWLMDPQNRAYNCTSEQATTVDGFLALDESIRYIFDLKAPTNALQIEQARLLAKVGQLNNADTINRFSVRFFDTTLGLASTVLPDWAVAVLRNDTSIRHLPYWVNVPSDLACLQIAQWIRSTPATVLSNRNLLGCFVQLNNEQMQQSWDTFSAIYNVSTDAATSMNAKSVVLQHQNSTTAAEPRIVMICDVPRELAQPDLNLWRLGYDHCMTEGFDMVHHPFAFPLVNKKAQETMSSFLIPNLGEEATAAVQSQLDMLRDPKQAYYYQSRWGFTLAMSDWSARRTFWFDQDQLVPTMPVQGSTTLVYRCITKLFTVMLFFRLQELGLLRLDDVVVASSNETLLVHNVTWWNVFGNTAGPDGRNAGRNFSYCSDLWKHTSAAVERATGLPFLVAVQHYVLDAVGAVGSYNPNTMHPPYEARGYEGPLEDMLVVGSTLANRGISPATGKRVLSAASVDAMLRDTILDNESLEQSFLGDRTAIMMMNRFRLNDPRTNATSIPVRGYSTGLWYTPGFRVDEDGQPIRGWISMGHHNALYFDKTGLVIAYHALQRARPPDIGGDIDQRTVFFSELSQPFRRVVSDIGEHLFDRMWDG